MFWKQSLHPHLNADGPGGKNAAAGASGWRPGPEHAKIASVDVNILFKKWLLSAIKKLLMFSDFLGKTRRGMT